MFMFSVGIRVILSPKRNWEVFLYQLFLNVSWNWPVKLSSPGVFFMGKFFITDSHSLVDIMATQIF